MMRHTIGFPGALKAFIAGTALLSSAAMAGPYSGMKNSLDISGIKLGMSHAEARAQLEAHSPKLKIRELVNDQRQVMGFEAMDCDKAPVQGTSLCPTTFVIHEVNGKVWWITRYIHFGGENKPTTAQVKDVLQKKYGALLSAPGVVTPAVSEYDGLVVNSSGDQDKRQGACSKRLGADQYDPPYQFLNGVDWSLRVDLIGYQQQFPLSLTTSLTDCGGALTELLRRQNEAKAKEQQRLNDATARAKAPKL